MKTESEIFGMVRGAGVVAMKAAGAQQELELTPSGALVVAQSLPPRAELVRQGQSWYKISDAAVCIALVPPTTTAPHTLWNGEPSGGKSLVIESISWFGTTSAGAASMFALMAMVNQIPLPAQPGTADTAVLVRGLAGKAYGGAAKSSHTVTVVNDGWLPISDTFHSGALTETRGISLVAPIEGKIIIPPGYLLSVACVALNATAAGTVGFTWHEVQLPS